MLASKATPSESGIRALPPSDGARKSPTCKQAMADPLAANRFKAPNRAARGLSKQARRYLGGFGAESLDDGAPARRVVGFASRKIRFASSTLCFDQPAALLAAASIRPSEHR
jgi:hypothetical protein